MVNFSGAISIPLDQLRDRHKELDPSTAYQVVCATGKTSYFVTRILQHHNIAATSLVGGITHLQNINNVQTVIHSAKTETKTATVAENVPDVVLDACGLACPGPIMEIKKRVPTLQEGQVLVVKASDPGFITDLPAYCKTVGLDFLGMEKEKGILTGRVRKMAANTEGKTTVAEAKPPSASIIVFSGDMDKVLAAFVIAHGVVASGGSATLFFTFWGLNTLRKPDSGASVDKSVLDKAFQAMMPKGVDKLQLSQMNMGGLGTWLMKYTMDKKHLPNLHDLFVEAQRVGIKMVACTMSMDALGIKTTDLVESAELGGIANFLGTAKDSSITLFI